MSKITLFLFLLFYFGSNNCKENIASITLPEIEITSKKQIFFNKENIGEYLPEYVLVGITNHECFKNAQITERIFMMEAVWNRVQYNFNNNGITLSDQLLAPKQFTGLFIYSQEKFNINLNSADDQYLIKLAREIIYEHRRIYPVKIYYWAGLCDSKTSHWKFVKKRQLKTIIKTKNIFST